MIHLHPSWKIDRIEEELRTYLADPERLQQMAIEGFIYARRYLTSTYVSSSVLLRHEYITGAVLTLVVER